LSKSSILYLICFANNHIFGWFRFRIVGGHKFLMSTMNENANIQWKDNSLIEKEASASVHMQLSELKDFEKTEVKDNSNLTISSFYCTSTKSTLVATVCLSNTTKEKLEYFGLHLRNTNLSMQSDKVYLETTIDPTDSEEYQKYLNLWKQGLFLLQSRSLAEEFSTVARGIKQKPRFDSVLRSNYFRMKNMSLDNNVEAITQYLQNQSIEGQSFASLFTYNESLSKPETLTSLKFLSTWFRNRFPYFYDQCSCCSNKHDNLFLGYVYPNQSEAEYLARGTELYVCGACRHVSRFPRFNNVAKVLETRKGRCGEYSVLMMLFLNALKYETRWVVDRDDHVSQL